MSTDVDPFLATKTPAAKTPVAKTARVDCGVCHVAYAPRLTGWACPVCDTAAPGAQTRRSRLVDSADDRLLAIVLVATIANVLLLAVLSVFVVRL